MQLHQINNIQSCSVKDVSFASILYFHQHKFQEKRSSEKMFITKQGFFAAQSSPKENKEKNTITTFRRLAGVFNSHLNKKWKQHSFSQKKQKIHFRRKFIYWVGNILWYYLLYFQDKRLTEIVTEFKIRKNETNSLKEKKLNS